MRGSRGWPQLTSSQVWEVSLDFVLASASSPSLRSFTGSSSALAEIWSGMRICPEYDWNFVQEKPCVKKRNYISNDLERGADEDTSPSNLYWGRVRGFEGHLVLKSGVISDFQTVIYIFKLVVEFAIRISRIISACSWNIKHSLESCDSRAIFRLERWPLLLAYPK